MGFVNVNARQYTLSRYVVAPMDAGNLLKVCAELAVAALRRGDGNVIVFLPGFREILEVERMVDESRLEIEYACEKLHSELMGADEEEQRDLQEMENGLLLLASSVAARAVTLPSLKYVFIHPKRGPP